MRGNKLRTGLKTKLRARLFKGAFLGFREGMGGEWKRVAWGRRPPGLLGGGGQRGPGGGLEEF